MRILRLVFILLLGLVSWSTPVMSAGDQVREVIVFEPDPCPHDENWSPTDPPLHIVLAKHLEWLESDRDPRDPRLANLCNASLLGSTLSDANKKLGRKVVDLSYADLTGANLSGAELKDANLVGAVLTGAKLIDADLEQADLSEAFLYSAKLNDADLFMATLDRVRLSGADLNGASMYETSLREVTFEPEELPEIVSTAGALHLSTMTYFASPVALFSLRIAFRDAGFRRAERQITYAIKKSDMQQIDNKIERAFNFVLFELTTEWGMSPGRPLQLLGLITLLFTFPSVIALRMPSSDGIWRVWVETRIRSDLGGKEPEKLRTGWWKAIGLGFYFSVLSAFRMGWRDLNVGDWIARVQRREYVLRATGWARTVAGFQSLISVYLLAMSVLTYFGRPFE